MPNNKIPNIETKNNQGILDTGIKWLWITVIFFIIDQYTKHYAMTHLMYREVFEVMPFFNFTLVYNEGAAFSFLADQGGWQVYFFTIVSSVVSLGLIYWLYTLHAKKEWWLSVSLSLILGGALGNLYDRVTMGKVTDFIDWYYGSYHFPAFNIADAVIFLGAAMMLWDSFFIAPKKEQKENADGK
ncbi:MAG: signal peptidase II [Kangiellaceae bacterium]